MSMETLELGGVLVLAMALVETIKIMVPKISTNGKAVAESQKEVEDAVWRTKIGGIIEDQHGLSKEMIKQIQRQNEVLADIKRALERGV